MLQRQVKIKITIKVLSSNVKQNVSKKYKAHKIKAIQLKRINRLKMMKFKLKNLFVKLRFVLRNEMLTVFFMKEIFMSF